MIRQGTPDFTAPFNSNGFHLFAPHENRGSYTFVPDGLEIARQANGRPDFSLEYVRSTDPFLPPEPHGVLDFRVRARNDAAPALILARQQRPDAAVAPPHFTKGFLRLHLTANVDDEQPADLGKPVSLIWNGLDVARFVYQLSPAAVTFLKKSLSEEILLLQALAEMEMWGIAPRLAVRLTFDPVEMLTALTARSDEQGRLTQAELVDFFRQEMADLPFQSIEGEVGPGRHAFAQVVADWVGTRLAHFVPAPSAVVEPYLALMKPEEVGRGRFIWDLSETEGVRRIFVLRLDPLAAAQRLVREAGLDAVFRETIISPLNTGVIMVSVTANLPPRPASVLRWGVRVYAPPYLPYRPQAINETVVFSPDRDATRLYIRFSPAETLAYTFTPFVIFHDPRGVHELRGETLSHSDERIKLDVSHFPLDFVPIEATAGLLAQATVHGTCHWLINDEPGASNFTLTVEAPSVTLALPKGAAAQATISIEARSLEIERTLNLEGLPAHGSHIGRYSFPEYGPHAVEIECLLGNETQLFALELLPEGREETTENISLLTFTPEQSQRTWHWFAVTPFLAGYRYRPRSGESPKAWSLVRSPFAGPLVINLRQGDRDRSVLDETFEFQDLRYYHSKSDTEQFYYIPGAPGPETDPLGRPTLLLLIGDSGGILQLGTRWQADGDVLEALRQMLAEQDPGLNPVLIRLAFAPVVLRSVELRLKNNGDFAVLQTSASSAMPPYSAIFNVQLTDEQLNVVMAALQGREGFLQVRYDANLEVTVELTEQIQLPLDLVTDVGTWFSGTEGDDHIRVVASRPGDGDDEE